MAELSEEQVRSYKNAVALWQSGAVNPAGVIKSLWDASCAALHEGGTDSIAASPAVQVIFYQVAFMLGHDQSQDSMSTFESFEKCRLALEEIGWTYSWRSGWSFAGDGEEAAG